MGDPNLPLDYIEESRCLHSTDYFFLDHESGEYFCHVCDKEISEEDEDFTGASDEPGFAPDR